MVTGSRSDRCREVSLTTKWLEHTPALPTAGGAMSVVSLDERSQVWDINRSEKPNIFAQEFRKCFAQDNAENFGVAE